MLPEPFHRENTVEIYCADNRSLLPLMEEGSIDLILTSPPYNLGTTAGGGFPGKNQHMGHYPKNSPLGKRGGAAVGKWQGGKLADGYDLHTDAMPHAEYMCWQRDFFRACWRLLSPTGAIFYNHKPRVLDGRLLAPVDYVPAALRKYVRQEIIWSRAGGINFSPAFYLPTHERIVIVAKPDFRLRDKAASGVGDVWYIPQESGTDHPAPFPLALARRVLETTRGQCVLDPFMGSGTTLVAGVILNRAKLIGIDNSEEYCRSAVERIRRVKLEGGASQQEFLPMGASERE